LGKYEPKINKQDPIKRRSRLDHMTKTPKIETKTLLP